jgi:hypothetical protein
LAGGAGDRVVSTGKAGESTGTTYGRDGGGRVRQVGGVVSSKIIASREGDTSMVVEKVG